MLQTALFFSPSLAHNTMGASRVFSCLILMLLSASWWCDQHYIIPSAVPRFVSVTGFQVTTPTISSSSSSKKRSCTSSSSITTSTTTNSFQLQPRGSHYGKERRPNTNENVAVPPVLALSAVAGAGLPTELPDSLDDAAQIAAQCCRDLVQMSGRTRCRVDIDTSAGDETYTLLKSSTQFMQKFTTALCYSLIPGLAPHRQDQLSTLIQAKADLNKLLEENTTDEELLSTNNSDDGNRKEKIEQLQRIVADGGRQQPWEGDIVRIFFPDEGSAALARRDWKTYGPDALVPPCVQFSSLGGVQVADTSKDVIVMYFCPRASEAHLVEEVLAKYEVEGITKEKLQFSVFINPTLVDMGVTGFGMAGRRLRERLIDTIPNAYYLRTLSWGALTRAWPRDFTVWQEEDSVDGGYRMIGQQSRLPSNPEVEDIYDIANNIQDDPALASGPGTFMGALNAFGDFVQGMTRL